MGAALPACNVIFLDLARDEVEGCEDQRHDTEPGDDFQEFPRLDTNFGCLGRGFGGLVRGDFGSRYRFGTDQRLLIVDVLRVQRQSRGERSNRFLLVALIVVVTTESVEGWRISWIRSVD